MKILINIVGLLFGFSVPAFAVEPVEVSSLLILLPHQTFELDSHYIPVLRTIKGSLIAEKFENEKSSLSAIKIPDSLLGIQPAEIVLSLATIGNLYKNPNNLHDKNFIENMRFYLVQAGTVAEENLVQQLINFKLLADFFKYPEVVQKTDNLITLLNSPLAMTLRIIDPQINESSPLQIIKMLAANNSITREMFLNLNQIALRSSLITIISYIKNYKAIYNAVASLNNIVVPLAELERVTPLVGRPKKDVRTYMDFLDQQFKKSVKLLTGYQEPTVGEYNEVIYFMLTMFMPDVHLTNLPYRKFLELKNSVASLPPDLVI